jgi:hypothetical protein
MTSFENSLMPWSPLHLTNIPDGQDNGNKLWTLRRASTAIYKLRYAAIFLAFYSLLNKESDVNHVSKIFLRPRKM